MRDTFILTGRVTPESSEEETGRITEDGQTLKKNRGGIRGVQMQKKKRRRSRGIKKLL